MIINHNLNAMNAHRNMAINTGSNAKALEKLSSGTRINRAGDDAAGLAISEKMRAQIRGLNQASRNAQDGISLIQTAEGALTETHDILQRMRELVTQGANDTLVTSDRMQIKKEIDQLHTEITRIATTTEFNTKKLIDGNLSTTVGSVRFQIGANSGQMMTINIGNMQASAGGLDVSKVSVSTGTLAASFTAMITVVNSAITKVSGERATLGSYQNRLEHSIKNLDVAAENLQASESRIRDVDMAKEMMNFTKTNILNQAAQAMLAQANQAPQGVLQLLR